MSNNAFIIAALIVAAYVLSQRTAVAPAGSASGVAPVVPGVTPGYYGTNGQWVPLAANAQVQGLHYGNPAGKADPPIDGLDVYQPTGGFQVPTIPPPMN